MSLPTIQHASLVQVATRTSPQKAKWKNLWLRLTCLLRTGLLRSRLGSALLSTAPSPTIAATTPSSSPASRGSLGSLWGIALLRTGLADYTRTGIHLSVC